MKSKTTNIKFNSIKQIYGHKDLRNGIEMSKPRLTKKGHFYQSNLDYISNGISKLISNNILDINKPFFDAGAGDARVLAVTSIIFKISSYGLEYDSEVVEDGLWKIEQMNKANLIDWKIPLMLKQGDFTNDASYKSLHLNFENIGTFFNFDNSYKDIAKKIKNQSPIGTIFLFMKITPRIEEFDGLKLIYRINLSNNDESRYNFCVYKKY